MSCDPIQNAKRKRPLYDSDDGSPISHLKKETLEGPGTRQKSKHVSDTDVDALNLMLFKVSLAASDLPLPSYASEHTIISVREEITTCPGEIIDLLLKDLSAGTLQAREDEARRLWQSFIDEAESLSGAQSIGSSGSSVARVANAQAEIPLEGVDREATLSADESWDDGKYGAYIDAAEPSLQSENGPPSDAEPQTETGDM
ncbi:hypothetical protein CGLO_00693 [Colletotrichum gloeosporioides Cg-14]|uniref:Uncharacterized protein n=1 Tax=Colletotrichum gloeosporioides (strain Cg-14) TaxID=1237896 RepID=T0KU07_COLGC|nr:hypothetical protein CGLO_00693 [Colletotrichum gloeosporioides Cg-14]